MLKGGLPTATTYYKKHKISKGETIAQSLKERFDYGQNPDKTEGGELISSYGCDHMTADAEFLLSKAKYKAATGREQRRRGCALLSDPSVIQARGDHAGGGQPHRL